jgi:hypothetical protein
MYVVLPTPYRMVYICVALHEVAEASTKTVTVYSEISAGLFAGKSCQCSYKLYDASI